MYQHKERDELREQVEILQKEIIEKDLRIDALDLLLYNAMYKNQKLLDALDELNRLVYTAKGEDSDLTPTKSLT